MLRQFAHYRVTRSGRFSKTSTVAGALLLFLIVGLIVIIPQRQVGSNPLTIEQKARIDAETSARVVMIQGIGGLFAFVAAATGLLNFNISKEKQATERFIKAVEMLGHNNPNIRLAGIYTLEQIVETSPEDNWRVIDILTAFIRQQTHLGFDKIEPFSWKTPSDEYYSGYDDYYDDDDYYDESEIPYRVPNKNYKPHKCKIDVQAALTALGRRVYTHQGGKLQILDLSRTDLSDAVLTGNLSGINLEEAQMQCVTFKDADLTRANLGKASLVKAVFDSVELRNATLQGANLNLAKLENTNLREANLSFTDCKDVTFVSCVFEKVNLNHASLASVALSNVNLENVTLESACLRNADLKGAKLSGAKLKGANLERANLSGAKLQGAILQSANLERANLSGAELQGANLRRSTLTKSNLQGAKLTGSDLRDSNLSEADLSGADLEGIHYERACFQGANLAGANLQGVHLTEEENSWADEVQA